VRQRALNGEAGRVTIFVSVQECLAEESVSRPPRSSRSISFPPCRLTAQDPGLSSRGMRVRLTRSARGFAPHLLVRRSAALHPSGRPNFLKEAPVLDPRPGNVLPYRIRMKPAGGPSPARASLCMRSLRSSNAPVCQSGVGSAILPERTSLELWCSTVAQRTFNPPGAGANPAGSTNFLARWESNYPAVRKTVSRRCDSGTRVQFRFGDVADQ
jgi:hypothetical protein